MITYNYLDFQYFVFELMNIIPETCHAHYWLSNVFITNGNGFKTQCSYVIWHIADLTILLKHARKKYHISCNVLWSWINLQCNTYKDNTQFTMKFQIKMVISPPCTISDSIVILLLNSFLCSVFKNKVTRKSWKII